MATATPPNQQSDRDLDRTVPELQAAPSAPGSGNFSFPPGLKLNLPFYILRRFFKPANPIALFEHLSATYGPISHYKLGWQHIVFVNDPEMIREILINQPQYFIKERTQRRMKILLGEGLITSEGQFHMRQRRIAAPAFHRQRIQAYADNMVERARRMREAWAEKLPQTGGVLEIGGEMMHLSLEIVARTLFNTEVTAEVRQINQEVNAIMDVYNLLIALPQAEKYLGAPIPGLVRFRRARARLDAVVHKMIADRRALMQRDATDHGDLLSMLMSSRDEEAATGTDQRMTDEQLRDELLTIFLAGYETTANALTWTWLLLAQNPEQADRFYAEVDSVLNGRLPTLEDLPQLRYTEQVFAESMRLYPPAWAMGRQAIAPFQLGPYHFPKDTYFFFSQYIMQRSARFFPDPQRFDPDRFTPENKAGRPRFAYFPFGGGGRQCIGEAFAWMEGVLLLATIAQRWRMDLLPGPIQGPDHVQPKITLRPKFPIHMRLQAR